MSVVAVCLGVLLSCCLDVVCAQANENATQLPSAQLAPDTSGGEVVGGHVDDDGQGEVALGSVDDAAMLQWAIAHADPERMSAMAAEVRGWTREQLEAKRADLHQLLETVQPPSDFQVMEALLEVASNSSETVARRAGALEALQEVVEAIDNAADLHKADGIRTLASLLRDGHADVRRTAAWAVGAAAQNNAEVQRQFLNTTCLPTLLAMVTSSHAEEAAKALYAVSALVRDNPEGLRTFYQKGGPTLLETIVADEEGDPRLQKKAVGLLGDLATFQGGRQAPGYGPLATPKVMSAMLRFMATGDVDMREKVMRAAHAMLANNPGGLKVFGEKAEELEKLRRIEERLAEMSKVGESEESGEGDREWQEYVNEMTEVIKQVGETVKDEEPPPMLGAAKGGRTKDEL
ncbi:hypothetical protein KFL_008020050 [Klebsormidium nitens]|uniref:Nucleotide exchange factor Fes1 domain-containing protein n=1 Tax=Klebsormidium nitens TaxID=105231 RepID=A0A1Y1IKY5_KLENI|nr:hypothetical protein KFL_008020050 [Klebsormidium nitens]|eukprot:GAQ91535.1 hypothetical protein KFL_008020050 [Klebsormidium nitens]